MLLAIERASEGCVDSFEWSYCVVTQYKNTAFIAIQPKPSRNMDLAPLVSGSTALKQKPQSLPLFLSTNGKRNNGPA